MKLEMEHGEGGSMCATDYSTPDSLPFTYLPHHLRECNVYHLTQGSLYHQNRIPKKEFADNPMNPMGDQKGDSIHSDMLHVTDDSFIGDDDLPGGTIVPWKKQTALEYRCFIIAGIYAIIPDLGWEYFFRICFFLFAFSVPGHRITYNP